MTYAELLADTAKKKKRAVADFNAALNGAYGFLVKADIERDPGMVAWLWLGKGFCETLAEHIGEFIEQAGGPDTPEAREIGDIYMAYEDGDPDIYYRLPYEAQLFEE